MSQEVDLAERAQLLRIASIFGPACFVILSLLWFLLHERDVIPGWAFGALLLLNIPITIAGIFLIHRATSGAAVGLTRALFSAGDIPPPKSYPHEDVLIAQGRYAEAAEYFRDHLTVEPDDNEARLRLAALLETHVGDVAGAERLYLEVRQRRPPATDREQLVAANGLIDLYRKTGRRDRLKVELARFADRYRGTTPGKAAARELRAVKAEDTASGS